MPQLFLYPNLVTIKKGSILSILVYFSITLIKGLLTLIVKPEGWLVVLGLIWHFIYLLYNFS